MSDLFDYGESKRRKEEGMDLAAGNQPTRLAIARTLAIRVARSKQDRLCHAGEVGLLLENLKIPPGPWMGSLFRGGGWEWTGARVKSALKSNHSRDLKVWRYLL